MLTDYAMRAQWYRSEFTYSGDLSLLRSLLASRRGHVLEVPCGAGRLLPIHCEHLRCVRLVDKEPEMIRACSEALTHEYSCCKGRVVAECGDVITWRGNTEFDQVLLPRGGLQVIGGSDHVFSAIRNLRSQMSVGAELFLDLHNPWSMCDDPSLPSFMRFTEGDLTEGIDRMPFKGTAMDSLVRQFRSSLSIDNVTVEFTYSLEEADSPARYLGDARCRWQRIDGDALGRIASDCSLSISSMWGSYQLTPWNVDSPRCIALLVAV